VKNNYIKRLLTCGIIGCLIFITTFLVEGVLREDYNPLRFPVSSLSIGERGWIQISNFILSGTLILAFALGLKSTFENNFVWIPRLIAMIGIGFIGAGIFSTDSIYGYPVTEPLRLAQFTTHGHLHDFFSLFVFICLPIVNFKFFKWFRNAGKKSWAVYSLLTGIMVIVTFILAGMGFKQVPLLVDIAGVFQRICIISGCLWLMMIAVFMLQNKASDKV
jgi:hypothetical protein